MKQTFKVLSVVLFAIALITGCLALFGISNVELAMIPLLLSGVTFYFYFFVSQIEPENYESQENWFNHEQLEDEE